MFGNVGIQQGGMPHVRFETRTEEDRAASIEQQRKVYRDVDWIVVTPHGSRDSMENHAEQWIANKMAQAHAGNYDIEWVQKYRKMYEMYKEGKELPVDGTPLAMLAHLFSPAEIANCKSLNVLSLETLAQANEETIARLGMGGRELKHRAQEAVKLAGAGTGDALKISALQTENADLQTRVRDLENVIRDLQVQMADNPVRRGPGRPPKE